MRKKDFITPKLQDLKKGNILPIYTDYLEQKDYEGDAELIEYKKDSLYENLPYIRAEVGGTEFQNPHIIMGNVQKWVIKFVTGPKKGFQTSRYISYFVEKNIYEDDF